MKPRSSNAAQDVVDDPCWGDPEHCNLAHLLTLVDRNQTILHESDDYVVMNKPADLRMDGEYPSSVHKLITYWYPPPSLQNHPNLLEHISTLHRHSETPDKKVQVRPCHQLDYATSGVLLMARNTPAASHASTMFEQRKVQKMYLAVLHGHLQIPKDRQTLPASTVTQYLHQQEDQHKRRQHKKRRPSKANSFQGSIPPSSFLHIWTGRYARKTGTGKRKRERLGEEEWDQVDKSLNLSKEECAKLSKTPWKVVKQDEVMRNALKRATDCYNQFLKAIIEKERSQEEEEKGQDDTIQELPELFCVEGEDPNAFYIYLSMAQVDDDFAMRIPDTTKNAPACIPSGDAQKLNFKVALTQCTILNHATLNSQPVTKVQLKPRTGRRHQLRVHTAFLGHSIVGDHTYENDEQKKSNLSPRMCLHAHELGFPLQSHSEQDEVLRVTAPDPFPVSDQGHLTVSSM